MAVAIEILQTEESEGERRTHYRRTFTGGKNVNGEPMGALVDEGWASAPIEPVPQEILLDRWDGIMGGGNPSKIQSRLDKLLSDIAERLIRRDMESEAFVDGELVCVDTVLDNIQDTIRDMMIARAAKVAAR